MDAVSLSMKKEIAELIQRLVGEPCTKQEVGRMKSLSLGFGKPVKRAIKVNEKVYREWEMGSYRSAWRVVKEGRVLCGSTDVSDSLAESNEALAGVELGRLAGVTQVNSLDVRVEFENDLAVEFLSTFSDDDECFHVFCPGDLFIGYSLHAGWQLSSSNQPSAGPTLEG